jgi:hypothetical protein
MAITATVYDYFPLNSYKKLLTDISAAGTDIKCCLLDSGHTPNHALHDSYNDVSTDEFAGTGYTAGGAEITSKTLTLAAGVITFDGADVSWATSTITARYAVIYDNEPAGATDKKLILLIDFGEDKSSTASTFSLVWNASGIFTTTIN